MPELRTESRFFAHGASLAEACWLVALATVPLVVDLFADGTFEPPKVRMLQSIAWLLGGVLIVALVGRGRRALSVVRHNPILLAALGVGLSTIVSTIFSIAPSASVWGDFERAQGLSATLCYLLVFAAVSTWMQRTEQAWRLVRAIIVAGVFVAIIGLAQQLGVDPLQITVDTTRRAPSTLGNPIFMAAYLGFGIVLAIAATLAAEGVDRLAWAAAALVQGLAFIGAGSRGPAIGLLAGLGLLAWLLVLERRRASGAEHADSTNAPPARWRAGATVGVVLLGLIVAVSVGPLRANLERLGLGGVSHVGTIRVRLDAWEAVSRTMLAPRATAAALRTAWPNLRMPFGYGPETASYPLGLHIADDLPALTRKEDRLDRAHNVVLQQLTERGSVGVIALLALWFLLLRTAITAAGSRGDNPPSPPLPTAATAMVATAGGLLVPWLVAGSIAWSGLGAAVALGAVVLWPALAAWRRTGDRAGSRRGRDDRQRWILMVGVSAALLAHFVELQSGIAVTPTRLAFWALAGLLASPWGQGKPAVQVPRRETNWAPGIVGIATGTLLISISQPPDAIGGPLAAVRKLLGAPPTAPVTAGLVVVCLVAAALLAAAQCRGWRRRSAGAAIALAVACTAAILASLPLDLAPSFRGLDPGRYAASLATAGLTRVGITVLVILWLANIRPWRTNWRALDRRERVTSAILIGAILAALAGPQTWAGAAATFGGIASGDARASRTGPAADLYRRALELQPAATIRWRGLARVYRAAAEQEPATATDQLAEAREALEQALELAPLESETHGELGSILMEQAIRAPADPEPWITEAVVHLERALELRPASRRALTTLRSALALRSTLRGGPR